MCLAIPAQIIKLLPEQSALVNVGGISKKISLTLLAEPVVENDFVIVHVGFALNKLDQDDAQKTLSYFSEILKG